MTLIISDSALNRINDMRAKQNKKDLMLRVTVEGGGCSGFQYKMELTQITDAHDHVFSESVVTDEISLPYLNGSIISYEEGLIGSEFTITNPNAKSGCGCGESFGV